MNSEAGRVRCGFPEDAAGLYGMDEIERLGLEKKKFVLHASKAGRLMKAAGFDDGKGFKKAVELIEEPRKAAWESEGELRLEEYRTERFRLLLNLDFPQEYLWMVKVKSREEFDRRWNGKASKFFDGGRSKPWVLHLNVGDELLEARAFSDPKEFLEACRKLTEYAEDALPSCLHSEIDDLALDLPRKWEHQPQNISGEAFFAGAAYLGDKIRQTLFPEEILYIILKVQERVKNCGAVEAVQRFECMDGTKIVCADTMKVCSDGWRMLVDPC